MEFIEKLYSSEYFAPILFTVVGVLTILFIIVLILALKDSKKSKNIVQVANNGDEEFVEINDKDLSIPMDKINLNSKNKTSKSEEVTEDNEIVELPLEPEVAQVQEIEPKVEENIVDNISNENGLFEEVKIEAPVDLVENIQTPEDFNSIKLEESPVASIDDVKQAESDLDAIAQTLLKAYQKEESSDADELPQINEKVVASEEIQPALKETNTADQIPSFNDIPAPQAVKVINSVDIVDSSKKEVVDINNLKAEEYTIKK